MIREVHREVHYVERPAETPTRVVEKVLVICPYCGTKNEQGVPKCVKCGGEL